MYTGTVNTNKVVNYSNRNVWCSYSTASGWKVRLLKAYSRSEWVVDIDYIMAQDSGVLINGRAGWWKIGLGGSFFIANHTQRAKGLTLGASAGGTVNSIRHYDDWAKGKQRELYEEALRLYGKEGYQIRSASQIAADYKWWASLMDPTAPLDA
jgi:hypothetical protein